MRSRGQRVDSAAPMAQAVIKTGGSGTCARIRVLHGLTAGAGTMRMLRDRRAVSCDRRAGGDTTTWFRLRGGPGCSQPRHTCPDGSERLSVPIAGLTASMRDAAGDATVLPSGSGVLPQRSVPVEGRSLTVYGMTVVAGAGAGMVPCRSQRGGYSHVRYPLDHLAPPSATRHDNCAATPPRKHPGRPSATGAHGACRVGRRRRVPVVTEPAIVLRPVRRADGRGVDVEWRLAAGAGPDRRSPTPVHRLSLAARRPCRRRVRRHRHP